MKILFMGTPDFAEASLEYLYNANCDVCGVYTQPDKPKNRGMKLEQSPVKKLALLHDTPVYQPTSMKDDSVYEEIKAMAPDVIIVVAYGKLLPERILNLPKYGCINIHGSILPKYRGAAPIQWSVLNGDPVTGVTAMYMDVGMDTGDIIAIKETEISKTETAGELFDRLKFLGAELLGETLAAIENGGISRVKQNEAEATYAPPLTKDLCPIDWNADCEMILNKIRGLNPWPTATAQFGEVTFKIHKAQQVSEKPSKEAGEIVEANKKGLVVSAIDGDICITELQAPGGKRMNAADYLRGHPIC